MLRADVMATMVTMLCLWALLASSAALPLGTAEAAFRKRQATLAVPRGTIADRAASLLEERGRAAADSQLEILALKVGLSAKLGNPQNLDEVKDLMRNMLNKLQEEHSNDVGLHEFCVSEVQNSKTSLTKLQDRREKAQADLDKLSAEADALSAKIADGHADLARTQKSLATAVDLRAKEHAANEERMANATNRESKHREVREKISVDDSKARAAEEAAADAALKERIQAEQAEVAAKLAFDRSQRDGQDHIRILSNQIQLDERKLLRMRADVVENTQDTKALDEQLSASKMYEQQIARKCTVPHDSHEVNQQRRQEHIRSLKEAYNILSGDGEHAV